MRIAYCGYDFFHSSLGKIIRDGHELVELFTWPTDNEYDFNEKVFSHAIAAGAKINLSPMTSEDLSRLSRKKVDAIVCAAYPYKVPEWRANVRYALNVHPSLLPEGRGPWPLPWVILNGARRTGVTVHEISPSWDAGAVLGQEIFSVGDRETLESLSVRSQMAAEELLSKVLFDIENVWAARQEQQGDASYWRMPQKKDRTITWDMPVEKIDRIVRAFSKFEPFVYIKNVRYFVRKVDSWTERHNHEVGSVVHESNREIVFAASDGLVCLTHFQKAEES